MFHNSEVWMMRKTCVQTGIMLLLGLFLSSHLPGQEMVTVPAGTRLVVYPNSTLNSGKNKSGDRFSVILAADLAADGVLVARRGDKIFGTVVESKKAGRVVRKAGMILELNDIVINDQMHPIVCHPLDLTGEKTGDLKKVAVKGAIGSVIGGAAQAKRMAGMGMAVAIITPGKQIEILEQALIEFYLSAPVTLPALDEPFVVDAAQVAADYLRSVGQNMKALSSYSWTSQLDIKKDGELKSSKRMLVHFDDQGKPVREPIGVQKEKKKKRGIRGAIQKKKMGEIQKLAEQIGNAIQSYAFMKQDMTQFLFQRGELCYSDEQTIQVQGIDILQPGDWIAIWLDIATQHPVRLTFKTILEDGEGLQAEIEYGKMQDGPFYPARAELFLPGKKITASLVNSDFSGGSR